MKKSKHIEVVDDDRQVVRVMEKSLEESAYDVTAASSGKGNVATVKEILERARIARCKGRKQISHRALLIELRNSRREILDLIKRVNHLKGRTGTVAGQ